MDRQECIKKYAYEWYEFYKNEGCDNNPIRDWLRAEHIVNAEEIIKHANDDNNKVINILF